jgi:hypothetical protein
VLLAVVTLAVVLHNRELYTFHVYRLNGGVFFCFILFFFCLFVCFFCLQLDTALETPLYESLENDYVGINSSDVFSVGWNFAMTAVWELVCVCVCVCVSACVRACVCVVFWFFFFCCLYVDLSV